MIKFNQRHEGGDLRWPTRRLDERFTWVRVLPILVIDFERQVNVDASLESVNQKEERHKSLLFAMKGTRTTHTHRNETIKSCKDPRNHFSGCSDKGIMHTHQNARFHCSSCTFGFPE
jgi:hypothetical protein